jgi:hypothetical protein
MNNKLLALISSSISKIEKILSNDDFNYIKSQFKDIYNNKISVSESYFNIRKDKKFDEEILNQLEEPFFYIGSLISIPARGAINILEDAYLEDVKDKSSTPFLNYQLEVMEEVYSKVFGS